MDEKKAKRKMRRKTWYSFGKMTIGCLLMAMGTSLFLLPNKLSSGGFAGISTIVYYFLHIPVGTTVFILNIPLLILCYFRNGKELVLKSLYGTLCFSLFINLTENRVVFTQDKVLSSIYGGILIGLGTALVLRENGSTGGSDLLTYIIRSFFPKFRSGSLLVGIDALIIFLNVMVFQQIEIGLYSFIAIYLVGKMIDIVFEGIYFTKMVYIISPAYQKIADEISRQIERGSTALHAKGMYENDEKMMLLCVATRGEVEHIKQITFQEDRYAFVIISNAREVRGKRSEERRVGKECRR